MSELREIGVQTLTITIEGYERMHAAFSQVDALERRLRSMEYERDRAREALAKATVRIAELEAAT